MTRYSRLSVFAGLCIIGLLFSGCADPGYKQAFSSQTALTGNSKYFMVPVNQTVMAVKQTLVKQGFTIDAGGSSVDTIKATRVMQDNSDKDISYNIQVSIVVAEGMTDKSSNVSLAANQQTILHKEWHTWWHLLWIIPIIPTGTEHQTVVTKEGNVDDPGFYKDFFTTLEKALPTVSSATKSSEES